MAYRSANLTEFSMRNTRTKFENLHTVPLHFAASARQFNT